MTTQLYLFITHSLYQERDVLSTEGKPDQLINAESREASEGIYIL